MFNKIIEWANDRNLILGSTPNKQLNKLCEEVDELTEAIMKDDKTEVKDAIGDCMVVLTIIAKQYGMTVDECVKHAYNEIKDRKGKMIDGIFVKESDLKELENE